MTRKKERKRAHVTHTATTYIQLKISFVVLLLRSSGVSVVNIPKQMLLNIAFDESSKAHLSKGT